MKTKKSERKNTLNVIYSRYDLEEGKISELENKVPEAVQDKARGGKRILKIHKMASVSCGTTFISLTQKCLKEVWERQKKVLEGIMVTLKTLMKTINQKM